MNFFLRAVDVFLHLDAYLGDAISRYGAFAYVLLFLIIFFETGLVITPFLPGDSLLFATGAFASLGALDVFASFALLSVAAILGDSVNYSIGRRIGPKAFERMNGGLLRREHVDRTRRFFERYGGKTIVFARFVPIVRTVAPFVAGIGNMDYRRFVAFNVIGGVSWIGIFLFGGYFFGNIPFVKRNFTMVILGIIAVSLLPGAIEYFRHSRGKALRQADGDTNVPTADK